MSLNLATMLRESATAYPDKPAAVFEGGRLTTRSSTPCRTASPPGCGRPA